VAAAAGTRRIGILTAGCIAVAASSLASAVIISSKTTHIKYLLD